MNRTPAVAAAIALCVAPILVATFAATTTAYADDYPSHPIIMIVPLAPGGSALARRIVGRRIRSHARLRRRQCWI